MSYSALIIIIALATGHGEKPYFEQRHLSSAAVNGGLLVMGVASEVTVYHFDPEFMAAEWHPNERIAEAYYPPFNFKHIMTELRLEVIEVLGGEYDSTYISFFYAEGKIGNQQFSNQSDPLEFAIGDTIIVPLFSGAYGRLAWIANWTDYFFKVSDNELSPYLGDIDPSINNPLEYLRAEGKTRSFKSLCDHSGCVVTVELLSWEDECITAIPVEIYKGDISSDTIRVTTRLGAMNTAAGTTVVLFLNTIAASKSGYELSYGHNSIYYIYDGVLFRNAVHPMTSRITDIQEMCDKN